MPQLSDRVGDASASLRGGGGGKGVRRRGNPDGPLSIQVPPPLSLYSFPYASPPPQESLQDLTSLPSSLVLTPPLGELAGGRDVLLEASEGQCGRSRRRRWQPPSRRCGCAN